MKKVLASLLLVGLIAAGCNVDSSYQSSSEAATATASVSASTQPQVFQPMQAVVLQPSSTTTAPASGLSNDSHYQAESGDEVHSPAFETAPNTIPAGASAQCRDGTYSFSESRSGTCSHHGGVGTWY